MNAVPDWAIFLGAATIMAYLPMAISKANQALGGAAGVGRAALAGAAIGTLGAGLAVKGGASIASNLATRRSAALAAQGRMKQAGRMHKVAAFSHRVDQVATRTARTSSHLMAQAAAGHYYIPLHNASTARRGTAATHASHGGPGPTPISVDDPESRHRALLNDAQTIDQEDAARPGGAYGDIGQINTKRYRKQYQASREAQDKSDGTSGERRVNTRGRQAQDGDLRASKLDPMNHGPTRQSRKQAKKQRRSNRGDKT